MYSGFTTPCSPFHIWKARGHVGVWDHLPGGGPPAFLLWPTSHVVCLCWTEPGVKMHRRFMFWKWSKIEFCFETLLGSKCYAAGLIVCDERIVVCNWLDRSVLMGSAVRWSETCFFSRSTHIKDSGLLKNKITVFSLMWTSANDHSHERTLGLEAALAASALKHSLSQVGHRTLETHIVVFFWVFFTFELVPFNPFFQEGHFRVFHEKKILYNLNKVYTNRNKN